MQRCFRMTQSFISCNHQNRLIDNSHRPTHLLSAWPPTIYHLSIHLFISRTCARRDWLIETCIIHHCVPAVIAALISERRGAGRRHNQSARGLTPDTMGCVDWMSGYPWEWVSCLHALRLPGEFFPHLQQFEGAVDPRWDAEATCSAHNETTACTKKYKTRHFFVKMIDCLVFNFAGFFQNV